MNRENYLVKAGDAVRLKAGGRTMRVDFQSQSGDYICRWHDGLKLKEGEFKLGELEIIEQLASPIPVSLF